MVNFRAIWALLGETVSEWQFKQVSLLAAALAYYTIFSIAPLLILVIMIVGAIYGEAAARGEIVGQIQGTVGEDAAQVIETAIVNLRENATGSSFRVIFSLGFLLFGASGVFAQVQNALNKIWEVRPEPGLNLVHFLRKRLLSFAMVLVIALLLFVSLVVNTALAALVQHLSVSLPGLGYVWQILSFFLSFAGLLFLFAAIYTILPDAKVKWRVSLVGATLTAALFMLGQYLFGLFLRQTDFGSAYGVAGSVLILITWIYYAAHILFIGAEFTQVYARRHGYPIVPEEHAVRLSPENDPSQQRSIEQTQDTRSGEKQQFRSEESSYNRMPAERQKRSRNGLTQIWRRFTRLVRSLMSQE